MTLSHNNRSALLFLFVSVILFSLSSIVSAADAMPAFSEDDFADCTITGMKLDYAVHYETETVDLANPMVWDNRKQDGQVLGEKETIGQATNYQRPERYYTPPKPFQYIKTSDTYPFYKVTVSFPGNPALNYELITELQEDGLIPVSIPPETCKAAITVEGYGEGVTTAAPLTFTNQEFFTGVAKTVEQGYYAEHVFQVTGTAPPRPVTDPALTNPGQNKCLASKLQCKQDKRINILRRFRDEVLVKSSIGKQLVKIYYEKSKPVVEALEGHEFCRTIAAALLGKIIPVIEMTLT